jgi:hypothetical protein
MKGSSDNDLFGIVASGLVLQKRKNKYEVALTGQRELPVCKNPPSEDQKRIRALAKPISIEDYTKQIAPRLYALEKTEPPPRVMPVVLAEWNLTPATDPKEVAVPPVEDPKWHRQAGYQKILTGAPK